MMSFRQLLSIQVLISDGQLFDDGVDRFGVDVKLDIICVIMSILNRRGLRTEP